MAKIVLAGTNLRTVYNREKIAKARAEQQAREDELRRKADEAREQARLAQEFEQPALAERLNATAIVTDYQADAIEKPTAADATRLTSDVGTSSTRTTWTFEITDINKIDLNAIRSHFTVDAIEKAIRSVVKAQKGATKIEGVRVFEDDTATFRRR
jgi:hypothetical protein